MWVVNPRNNGDSVVNIENGHTLAIRSSVNAQGIRTWEVASSIPVPGVQTVTVMDGYKTYEDAQTAFKDLLTHLDIDPFETDDPTVVPADDEEGK